MPFDILYTSDKLLTILIYLEVSAQESCYHSAVSVQIT